MMTRSIFSALAMFIALAASSLPRGAVLARGRTFQGAPYRPARLLYIASGHLRLRPVDGGPARVVATPWPMTVKDGTAPGFRWSSDGRRVALDDSQGRLAVINFDTGRITVLLAKRCYKNCSPPAYAWSPNSRYLALVQPQGSSDRAVLRVWDSNTGTARTLLGNVSAFVAYPEWSHDSTRIGVPVGHLDTVKNRYPTAVLVDLAGHTVALGTGEYLSWSPDDRLIGLIRPNFCGANTCDEDVIVKSSAGGPAHVLARHSTSLFDNPLWAPQPHGYAFDRWILDPAGRPLRRLAGPHERVVSWKPDGSRVALQTYYPYQGTPDVLSLSTPSHARVHLYTDGWNQGCGACSKDVYAVTWSSGATLAFTTPTYPTPKNVTVFPKVFVSSLGGTAPARVPIPAADTLNVLGLVNADSALIVQAKGVIYRYTIPSRRLEVLVRGVAPGYNTAELNPPPIGTR